LLLGTKKPGLLKARFSKISERSERGTGAGIHYFELEERGEHEVCKPACRRHWHYSGTGTIAHHPGDPKIDMIQYSSDSTKRPYNV
jgi:hypothetical protein